MELLLDKLKKYTASGSLPMHMPGHKRNESAFPWLAELGCGLDITEIDGFDNLNDPQELFRDLEHRCAQLWGAKESICLVNGSTSGILTAVRAALEHGGDLLMFRGSHKSVYHAAEITGAVTHYLTPQIDPDSGIWGSMTAEEVAEALDTYPEIRLVAITSPTYEGIISDVRLVAAVCHARGVPLLVDEAHGAHLGLGGFPESAVRCGADLVVQSLHKTLPALTQTAVLHINGALIDPLNVRRNAAMFQSSSPSYLLSASIDGCVRYLEREGNTAADRWLAALRRFEERMRPLEKLRVLHDAECFFARDPSKIVISTAGTNLSGSSLMAVLRDRFQVELEMAAGDYVVAMTGMGDTKESLDRLAEAVLTVDTICQKTNYIPKKPFFELPECCLPIHKAVTAPGEFYEPAEALGKISGEYVFAYPPGVPLLVPGEVIGETSVRAILSDVHLRSTRGGLPERIFCVEVS